MNKTECRKLCLHKLKRNTLFGKLTKDKRVGGKLLLLLEILQSKNVLIYYPLNIESDIKQVINKTRSRYNFYLPFMEDVSFKMVPFRLPIKKYKFDIKQSGNSFFKNFKIDTVVVPIVGIDYTFRRVGFGKGMYDRFFDSLNYRPNIIFVQPCLCKCEGKVTSDHDIDGDYLITPKTLFFKQKKGLRNDSRNACRGRHSGIGRLFYYKKN